ncbi:MAG: TIGR03936 family radical SAM-associated protein [Lachnospiraceae bacterium]|nr:TIGR03936 family radical SAM-associated protein [Lachnospiraceae bacterium]
MKLRVKFAKYGAVKFIGHLDLMRFFQKAVRRAGIDIAYSGGYSPHQVMSFASPLGVGLLSNGEYFDIEVNSAYDMRKRDDIFKKCDGNEIISSEITDIKMRLAEQMVDGLDILDISPLDENAGNAMASVAAALYTVSFAQSSTLPVDWTSQFGQFLQSSAIIYTKRTKKVVREIDLKPLIYKAVINADNSGISLLINASSADSIKPQFVIEAFIDYIGQSDSPLNLIICREEIYTNIGTGEKPDFIPLIA